MAEALISVLLEQLASVVYQHTNEVVKLVLNADKDVKSFSSKLKAIQAVLEDAEKKQVTEASVGDWLEKLKDVSYEMDDVLDEWNTELLRQQVEEKQEMEGDNALVTKKKITLKQMGFSLSRGRRLIPRLLLLLLLLLLQCLDSQIAFFLNSSRPPSIRGLSPPSSTPSSSACRGLSPPSSAPSSSGRRGSSPGLPLRLLLQLVAGDLLQFVDSRH